MTTDIDAPLYSITRWLPHYFRLTIFASLVAATIALSVVLNDGYVHIVSLRVNETTHVYIYEDSFCDFASRPTFEIERHHKLTPRCSTELWLDCGSEYSSETFRVISADAGALLDVVYAYALALTYDLRSNVAIPNRQDQSSTPESFKSKLLPVASR